MKTNKLDYFLPKELIAQHPLENRGLSRLLVMNRTTGELQDRHFGQVGDFLRAGDCLVINDTRVIPARFFARRKTGKKLEGLFLTEPNRGIWEVMMKGSARLKTGESILLIDRQGRDSYPAEVCKSQSGQIRLTIKSRFEGSNILEKIGFTPLPPYIQRAADRRQDGKDRQRYQTVYARENGAIAAPTAGLHFVPEHIEKLKRKGIIFARITLHVGAGTFKPISTDKIEEHKMHSEKFRVDEENAELINHSKREGARIIAVGTTSVRALETVAANSKVRAYRGETGLFIRPGYKFNIIDGMITNFHLPRSTLLALVGAFAGPDNVLTAYRYAIEQRYRFYSYGDAMLIV